MSTNAYKYETHISTTYVTCKPGSIFSSASGSELRASQSSLIKKLESGFQVTTYDAYEKKKRLALELNHRNISVIELALVITTVV